MSCGNGLLPLWGKQRRCPACGFSIKQRAHSPVLLAGGHRQAQAHPTCYNASRHLDSSGNLQHDELTVRAATIKHQLIHELFISCRFGSPWHVYGYVYVLNRTCFIYRRKGLLKRSCCVPVTSLTLQGDLSFHDMVRAFRRKKLIESLMRGGEARLKVVEFHEK